MALGCLAGGREMTYRRSATHHSCARAARWSKILCVCGQMRESCRPGVQTREISRREQTREISEPCRSILPTHGATNELATTYFNVYLANYTVHASAKTRPSGSDLGHFIFTLKKNAISSRCAT